MSSSSCARRLESSAKSDERIAAAGANGGPKHGTMTATVLTRLDLRGCADLAGALARSDPVDADDDDDAARRRCARSSPTSATRGDAAVRELTERFDGCDARPTSACPPPTLRAALDAARARAAGRARGRRRADPRVPRRPARRARAGRSSATASTLRELAVPVGRAGCYVPGGRAAYPSTVLMTAIPAQLAGVAERRALRPARGRRHACPTRTLAAAALAGVTEVYRIGGAQAIAALAYGTETIRPVDVIVGPGNALRRRWPSARSRARSASTSFAGPSEVVVVADGTRARRRSPPPTSSRRPSTAPAARRSLVTWDADVADAVDAARRRPARRRAPRAPRSASTLATGGRIVLVDDAARRDRRGQRDRARAPRAA